MKKILSAVLIISLILTFCGCKEDVEEKDKLITYLDDKYSAEFTEVIRYQIEKTKKTVLNLYTTTQETGSKQILLKYTKQKDNETYIDNYEVVKNYDDIIKKLDSLISQYFPSSDITLNLYLTAMNDYYSDNMTADDILKNNKNNIRVCVYVNTSESKEDLEKTITQINNTLKQNRIYVSTIYYAFFDKDFSLKDIDTDPSYDYALDSLSRIEKYKDNVKNEYFSYWRDDENNYNYMIK